VCGNGCAEGCQRDCRTGGVPEKEGWIQICFFHGDWKNKLLHMLLYRDIFRQKVSKNQLKIGFF